MHEGSTRILAIRHGETAWNQDGRIQGHIDIPLNTTGRWQARQLVQAVAGEDLAAVYSSDLLRALDTARAVAEGSGAPLHTHPALRERSFGVFEGSTFDQIAGRLPEQSQRWRQRDPVFAPDGGESLQQFYARCVGVAEQLARAHPGESIALVAHGGVLDCLYRAATRLDLQAPRSWLVANASINRLLFTEGGFSLVGWGDVSHLENAAALDELAEDRVGPAA